MKRTTRYVFAGLLVLSLVLSVCAPVAAATQAPASTQPSAAAS